jgi:predicted peptidase
LGTLRSAALLATLLLVLPGCLSDLHRHTQGHVDLPNACRPGSRRYTYAVYVPPGFDDPARAAERWPLLLYFPGTLTFGHDVRRLASGDPPELVENGRDLPMVVLTPMTPKFWERWHPSVVMALVDHAIRRYRVDPDRVYLSGVSLGGVAAWDTAIAYPDRIAAIVPVAAWAHPQGIERMVDVPVWAFHGALDFAIPTSFQGELIERLRAAGGEPRFTIYPWGFHWIWGPTYARDDLYAWMLDQSLAKRRSVARTRVRADAASPPGDAP